MIAYLDTSALVKLYVAEEFSDRVREIVNSCSAASTHMIAYVEARAAFARLNREDRLSQSSHAKIKVQFDDDWGKYAKVETLNDLVRRAGDLAEAFALRVYDSVHLASAEYVKNQSTAPIIFACFDRRLNRAASALGMKTI